MSRIERGLAAIGTGIALSVSLGACGGKSEAPRQKIIDQRAKAADAARRAMHPAIYNVHEKSDGSLNYSINDAWNGNEVDVKLYCLGPTEVMLTSNGETDTQAPLPNTTACLDGRINEAEINIAR